MNGYKILLGVGLEFFVDENAFLTFARYIQDKFIDNKGFWGYDFGIVKAERSELTAADREKYNVLDESSFGFILCYKDTDGDINHIFVEDHNYTHFLNHIAYRHGIPTSRSKWCCPVLDSLAHVYCGIHRGDPSTYTEALESLCEDLLKYDNGFYGVVDQIAEKLSYGISGEECNQLIKTVEGILAECEAAESEQVDDWTTY